MCTIVQAQAHAHALPFSANGELSKNFIGIRYIYQRYQSRDGIFNNSPWVEENFNTLQLWGKIPVTEKLSVIQAKVLILTAQP